MATSADVQAYNSDLDAFEYYHAERSDSNGILSGPALPALGHGLAGAVGAAVSNVAIYPLNLLITRSQTKQRKQKLSTSKHGEPESVLAAAHQIYEQDGLAGLYAGCSIDTAKTIADSFLFFMAYNLIRQTRLQAQANAGRKNLPVLDELGVGFAAGAFSKFFTAPLSNIVTRLQTTTAGRGKHPGIGEIAASVRKEKGLAGFWTGYSASLVLTLNPSLTFFFFESLKRATLSRERRDKPPPFATFFLAAVSKAMASAVTYPFSLAKARAQTTSRRVDDNEDEVKDVFEKASIGQTQGTSQTRQAARRTVFSTIAHIARTDGLEALYEGLELELLKGFLSHGLTMVVKEAAHKVIIRLYYAVLKMLNMYPSPEELAERGKNIANNAVKTVKSSIPDGGSVGESSSNVYISAKESIQDVANETSDMVQENMPEKEDVKERMSNMVENAIEIGKNVKKWSVNAADDMLEKSKELGEKALGKAEETKTLIAGFVSDEAASSKSNGNDGNGNN